MTIKLDTWEFGEIQRLSDEIADAIIYAAKANPKLNDALRKLPPMGCIVYALYTDECRGALSDGIR